MTKNNAIVATFADHQGAETAIRKLAEGGMDIKRFSIIGKGYHKEETVMGFYNSGTRIKFWGANGAMWGGLWGLFFGGIFVTVPLIGPVIVLGHFAAMVLAGVEGAVVVGGMSALGAALFSLGIPKNSVIRYEEALKTDAFLLMAHGPVAEMARAKAMIEAMKPAGLDLHTDVADMPDLPGDRSPHHAAG